MLGTCLAVDDPSEVSVLKFNGTIHGVQVELSGTIQVKTQAGTSCQCTRSATDMLAGNVRRILKAVP